MKALPRHLVFFGVIVCWFSGLVERAAATPWGAIHYGAARLWDFEPPPAYAPTLVIPGGVSNVAAGKTVSSNGEALLGELGQVVDGIKFADKPGVHDDGDFVEITSQEGVPWVQIDLQTDHDVYAVWLWFRHPVDGFDIPDNVVVLLSSDPRVTNDAHIIYNCDKTNRCGFGVGTDRRFASSWRGTLIHVDGRKGRYVRMYSRAAMRSAGTTEIVEVEVYGIPAAAAPNKASRWHIRP